MAETNYNLPKAEFTACGFAFANVIIITNLIVNATVKPAMGEIKIPTTTFCNSSSIIALDPAPAIPTPMIRLSMHD